MAIIKSTPCMNSPGKKVGLLNIGNTCYMNSVIQCLCNIPEFVEYMLNEEFYEDFDSAGNSSEIVSEFRHLLQALRKPCANKSGVVVVHPQKFKTAFCNSNLYFAGNAQHDAHEFLVTLLNYVHSALKYNVDVNIYGNILTPKDEMMINSYEKWREYLSTDQYSIVTKLFCGQLCSEINSLETDFQRIVYEPFMFLATELPLGTQNITLYDCLNLYTGTETLQNDNKYKLENVNKYVDAKKQITIWRPPPVLIIQLKRFYNTGVNILKNNTLVTFPVKNFDISQYVSGTVKCEYELCGVVNHMGSLQGGHYYSNCLNGTEWLTYNDSQVCSTSSDKIVTHSAYLLFYKQQSY